eukprot:13920232-Ditylum_brightwellii.AAC.1
MKLTEFCTMHAKCQIGFNDHTHGLMPIIETDLQKAIHKQSELGIDDDFRFIHFKDVNIRNGFI